MDTNRIEGDVNNSGEGGEGEKETGRVKKRAVTIFLRKKNKAVGTLPLHTETEEEIKYILIMKMQ